MMGFKKSISFILCGTIVFVNSLGMIYAEENGVYNTKEVYEKQQISQIERLVGEEISQTDEEKIKSEMAALEICNMGDISIEEINIQEDGGNEYILDFNGIKEVITFDQISNDKITYTSTEGDLVDTCTITSNGRMFIDGGEVSFYNSGNVNLKGTVWKSTKSKYPLGGHKVSDYTKYLSSGQSNAAMDQAWSNATLATVTTLLGVFKPFVGIAATFAISVRDVFKAAYPRSKVISCKYTTYIADHNDYQYRTKVYATSNYTGKYVRKNTYEHFIVY